MSNIPLKDLLCFSDHEIDPVKIKFNQHNGKLYVGSATSEKGMLLQRWSNYVHDGHGGNKLSRGMSYT